MVRQIIDSKDIYNAFDRLIESVNFKKIFPILPGFYMNKHLRFIFLILLLNGPFIRSVNAQTAFTSEEELKSQALKLFEEDEFEEAYPLYSQLVSLYPKDANYNYRLGVCMLYASDDKEKAIPFLVYAAKNPEVEKEVLFYLAKAYHLNYRFDDAIAQYQAYEKAASEAKANKLQVEHQIEMCRNGKKLLRNITDLVVIEKKELSKADFYRAYDISDIGGKLLAKPDEESFRTSLDKKKKEKSIIYLASNNNQIYFSSYGDDLKHGKDIYLIRKLPSGEWSKPQTLGYPVNTAYDEDFPFLHPNGKDLYFCSKGHNSMGGYDIFKTTLNEETNTWSEPVNLDFPINTPDDDILYVTNENEKEAYFSSARSSKLGKTAVYHINVERKPIEVAIIKGAVIKNRDDQALDVKITVKDLGDNTILGIYNAKAETGGFIINLPNGGKFMYTVESIGFNTQSEVVIVPTQYVFKPLKQEISYELGTDKLIIKNLFDEPVDDQSYLLALNFIKEKAKLDAGINDFSAAASKTKTENAADTSSQKITAVQNNSKTAPASLSNADIVKIAYDDAKDAAQEAKDLQEQADVALNLANEKNELAQNKNKEAVNLAADANGITDNIKKQAALDEANQSRNDADELNQETVAAFNIAKKIGLKAAAKEEEAGLSMQYAKDLEAAVKSKDPLQALTKLEDQEKKLEALSEKNGSAEPDNIFAGLKIDSENKKRELDKAVQTSADIKQEIADNETLIANLQAEADKTKKDDLKKGLLDQMEGLRADNEQSKKDLAANDQKISKTLKEFNGIKNEMELVNNVAAKSKTGTNEEAAASAAAIDKTKLEQQVNELKTASDNAAANTAVIADAGKNKEDKNISQNTQVVPENKTELKSEKDIAAENGNSGNINNENGAAEAADYNKQYSEQAAAAAKIPDELERENKKAAIYKEWAAAINTDLAEKKQNLKTEKDKEKKNALNTAAAALENDLRTKQEEEKTITANAEKLQQQALAANNSQAKKADNNTAQTNAASADSTAGSSRPQNINSVNETFNDKMAGIDKIQNETEREAAKADVLIKWSAAIDKNIEKQKSDFLAATDPEMKALLAKKIGDAEALSKEKQSMADASTAKAAALKSGQAVAAAADNKSDQSAAAVNNNAVNSENTAVPVRTSITNSAITDTYAQQLTETGKISNEAERENAKAEVLKKWSAAIDKNIEKQKADFVTITDPAQKALLAKEIGDAETQSQENQKQADESLAKTAALKSGQTAVAAASDNSSKTAADSEGVKLQNEDKSEKAATIIAAEHNLENALAKAESSKDDLDRENKKKAALENFVADSNILLDSKETALKNEKNKNKKNLLISDIASVKSTIAEKQKLLDESNNKISSLEAQKSTAASGKTSIENDSKQSDGAVYASAAAAEKIRSADAVKKESDDLMQQADDLKVQAAKANQPEKDVLNLQAADLVKRSEAKKVKGAQLTSDANRLEFLANKNELDQLALITKNKDSDEISMAEMMKDEAGLYFDKSQKSREMAANTQLTEDKGAALDDALQNENIALQKQRKALEIYKKNNPGFIAQIDNKKENASSSLTEGSENAAAVNTNNNAVTSENTVAKSSSESAANNSTNSIKDKQPDAINNNTNTNSISNTNAEVKSNAIENYDLNSKIVYSVAKPIPVNEKLPDGLVFKVQIGAFRSPIAPEIFKGMSPLSAETTPQGFTRYTAGLFTKFATADKVKEEIKDLGYKDAFVAAFLNGKRISTAEALQMSGIEGASLAVNNAADNAASDKEKTAAVNAEKSSDQNTVSNSKLDQNKTSSVNAEKTADQNSVSNSKELAAVQNVAAVSGLFYTVQIGVYSQAVTSAKLHNLNLLYTETAANGNLRYNTGIYNNVPRANEARDIAVNAGVKDAFVTAYYQGKRISLADAKTLEAQGQGVFSTAPAINQLPSVSIINNKLIQPNNNEAGTEGLSNTAANDAKAEIKSRSTQTGSNPSDTGLVYKVQIGAFKNEVPLEIADRFLKIANKGIKNYKDAQGLTIYTLGSFKTYEDANNAKLEIMSVVPDAFIAAYDNGKKISIDEAKKLQNR